MSRITDAFSHGKAFIPFLTCGDPDLETTEAAVRAMHLPAADCFLEEFLPAFKLTLDEQN